MDKMEQNLWASSDTIRGAALLTCDILFHCNMIGADQLLSALGGFIVSFSLFCFFQLDILLFKFPLTSFMSVVLGCSQQQTYLTDTQVQVHILYSTIYYNAIMQV